MASLQQQHLRPRVAARSTVAFRAAPRPPRRRAIAPQGPPRELHDHGHQELRRVVFAGASATHAGAAQQLLRINLSADTTLALPLSVDGAESLRKAVRSLAETLAAKAKATRPQRWPLMEWRLQQQEGSEVELLEVVCNPNACSSIFEARALVTLRTRGGLRVTSETRIPALQADLDAFLGS